MLVHNPTQNLTREALSVYYYRTHGQCATGRYQILQSTCKWCQL